MMPNSTAQCVSRQTISTHGPHTSADYGIWRRPHRTTLPWPKFFQQAVDLDRNFADAYCGVALAQIHAATVFLTRPLADLQTWAEPLVRLAVALDGNNAVARSCLSYALYLRGDHHGAMAEAERALALSPNLALGHWRRGVTLIRSGRPHEGV